MRVSIVPMTSEEEARGKAYVYCTAWKEAYRGPLSQGFLDARTLEFLHVLRHPVLVQSIRAHVGKILPHRQYSEKTIPSYHHPR